MATKCSQLKLLSSDGKKCLTDVADVETLFRLIQIIPSKKARLDFEEKTGKKVISKENFLPPPKESSKKQIGFIRTENPKSQYVPNPNGKEQK